MARLVRRMPARKDSEARRKDSMSDLPPVTVGGEDEGNCAEEEEGEEEGSDHRVGTPGYNGWNHN